MMRHGHQHGIDELAAVVTDHLSDSTRLSLGEIATLQERCRLAIEQGDRERHAAASSAPLARRDAEQRWRVVADFARWGR